MPDEHGNLKLRDLSYVFAAIALVGFGIVFHMLFWVERLSGDKVFAKTFESARLVVKGREQKIEQITKLDKLGPYRLVEAKNPYRCSLDLSVAMADPEKMAEERLLGYEIAMVDPFGNRVWEQKENIPRETASPGGEPSTIALTVHVFDVPYDGEFTFPAKIDGPGLVVQKAELRLRSQVSVGSPEWVIAGGIMFFVGLLVSISFSKAYDQSKPKPEGEDVAEGSAFPALGDASLVQKPDKPAEGGWK